jgi:hypothetical protein
MVSRLCSFELFICWEKLIESILASKRGEAGDSKNFHAFLPQQRTSGPGVVMVQGGGKQDKTNKIINGAVLHLIILHCLQSRGLPFLNMRFPLVGLNRLRGQERVWVWGKHLPEAER